MQAHEQRRGGGEGVDGLGNGVRIGGMGRASPARGKAVVMAALASGVISLLILAVKATGAMLQGGSRRAIR